MYLLNAVTTIEWEILPTSNPPAIGDLDLLIIKPTGATSYETAPLLSANYMPPTTNTPGRVTYEIQPNLEGLWKIRLVTGNATDYNILSKVEMFVFDSTLTTSPYSDEIGRPAPYDINFYLQGYIVPNEIFGTFVASRTVSIDTNSPDSRAICEESAEFFETSLDILYNDTTIGSIVFPVGSLTGNITIASQLIGIGDRLQIVSTGGTIDARIRDIAINIVGCCTVVPCTVL